MIRVQSERFDAAAETAALLRTARGAGAVASFVGVVRGDSGEGRVAILELEHHPRFTLAVLEAIGSEARRRFDLVGLAIVHRHGAMPAGDPIVFVGAAARHRRSAFEAVDYLMDRLKVEAPFWKREHGSGGVRWVEPGPGDRADRARWDVMETDHSQA